MFDKLLDFIAPHYCYSCQKRGHVLCNSCRYNIVSETQNHCFDCRIPSINGVCQACATKLPFAASYFVGERLGELEKMLDDFKFQRTYRVHKTLAQLLDDSLPRMPPDTLVIPIPTIAKHVRRRGYDHTDLITRAFAKRRRLKSIRPLQRTTNTVQLGATARERRRQAQTAYACPSRLQPETTYLLLDDIATTGATLTEAARCLRQAGAQTVVVAVVARQPLKT